MKQGRIYCTYSQPVSQNFRQSGGKTVYSWRHHSPRWRFPFRRSKIEHPIIWRRWKFDRRNKWTNNSTLRLYNSVYLNIEKKRNFLLIQKYVWIRNISRPYCPNLLFPWLATAKTLYYEEVIRFWRERSGKKFSVRIIFKNFSVSFWKISSVPINFYWTKKKKTLSRDEFELQTRVRPSTRLSRRKLPRTFHSYNDHDNNERV